MGEPPPSGVIPLSHKYEHKLFKTAAFITVGSSRAGAKWPNYRKLAAAPGRRDEDGDTHPCEDLLWAETCVTLHGKSEFQHLFGRILCDRSTGSVDFCTQL